jgi:hypothetical protein
MAIINQRWPEDLAPDTCVFGRSRNDVLQRSPVSRKGKVLRQGRPLWSASLTWQLPNSDRLAKLLYLLEALDGYAGSVQLWDFARPFPETTRLTTSLLVTAGADDIPWTFGGTETVWTFGGAATLWSFGGAGAKLAAGAGAGATSFTVTGFAAGIVAAIQGQAIQIGRRRYVVAADAVTDGAGTATITILGGLITAAAANDVVRMQYAACEMQLAAPDYDNSATAADGFIRVSAQFTETVEDFAA